MELENLKQAALSRQSIRSYDGEKLSEDDCTRLAASITKALGQFEAQGSRIALVDIESEPSTLVTYGVIGGCRSYLVLISSCRERARRIKAAAAMELCVLEATAMGLSTCWLGATFRRSIFTPLVSLQSDEDILAIVAIGRNGIKSRLVDRLMQTLIRSRERKTPSQLFFANDASTPLAPDSALLIPLETLRIAPSSTNSQPWRIIVLDDNTFDLCSATDTRYTDLDMGIATAHIAVGFAPAKITFAPPAASYPRLISIARCKIE